MCAHRLEIAVVMQENVVTSDAECADDHVDRLPDGDATRPQEPVIAGSLDGDRFVEHRRDGKMPQGALDPGGMSVVPGALQDFEENEIAGQDPVVVGFNQLAQPDNRRGLKASQVSDPNRGSGSNGTESSIQRTVAIC